MFRRLTGDFLACSVYKFYGPYVGVLWVRRSLLEELRPEKLTAAFDAIPSRYEELAHKTTKVSQAFQPVNTSLNLAFQLRVQRVPLAAAFGGEHQPRC